MFQWKQNETSSNGQAGVLPARRPLYHACLQKNKRKKGKEKKYPANISVACGTSLCRLVLIKYLAMTSPSNMVDGYTDLI